MHSIMYGLLAVGILLFFSSYIMKLITLLYEQRKKVPKLLMKLTKSKKMTLRKKIQLLNYGRKQNFFESSYNSMTTILQKTGEESKIKTFKVICMATGGTGFLIAVYLRSYMLIPILTGGLALLPMWLMKFKQFRYNMKMNSELSVVLSIISSSYIRSENILDAVKLNLPYLNGHVKHVFETFIRNNSINVDIEGNIRKLKREIDNKIFHLWCDNLIICRENINQKYALKSIVEQFAFDKSLWDELITELKKPILTMSAVIAICFSGFYAIYMLGNSMNVTDDVITQILFESLGGQIIVVLLAVTVLYGVNKSINLSTSID